MKKPRAIAVRVGSVLVAGTALMVASAASASAITPVSCNNQSWNVFAGGAIRVFAEGTPGMYCYGSGGPYRREVNIYGATAVAGGGYGVGVEWYDPDHSHHFAWIGPYNAISFYAGTEVIALQDW
jgi:hypothetical protein